MRFHRQIEDSGETVSLEKAAKQLRIGDIPFDEGKTGIFKRPCKRCLVSDVGQAVQYDDAGTPFQEMMREVAANKTGATGKSSVERGKSEINNAFIKTHPYSVPKFSTI